METSQSIYETENKKLKEELTHLRSDIKGEDVYLKNKLRILEDRSRRNNIRVEGIPGSEHEEWDVTEEKLKKDELDIENVITEREHRVKRIDGNIENNDQTEKSPHLLLSYYILKTNRIS